MIITRGYLIHRQEYEFFDEIITFINEYGNKFTCYCAGSKKILSKNGRNLDYLNYLEFEFFYSQSKLSRLKKVTTINFIDNKIKDKLSFIVFNEFLYKSKKTNLFCFQVYQKMINYLLNNLNDFLLILYLLYNICCFLKIRLNFIDNNILNSLKDDLYGWDFEKYNILKIKQMIRKIGKEITNMSNICLMSLKKII